MSKIRLHINGLGHAISFKNSKQIIRKGKHPSLITKPEYRQWMDRVEASFESQLRSEFQTRGIVITTGHSALSLIASWLPLDDSRKWIPEISVSTQLCAKGKEGADVLIERIDVQEI